MLINQFKRSGGDGALQEVLDSHRSIIGRCVPWTQCEGNTRRARVRGAVGEGVEDGEAVGEAGVAELKEFVGEREGGEGGAGAEEGLAVGAEFDDAPEAALAGNTTLPMSPVAGGRALWEAALPLPAARYTAT